MKRIFILLVITLVAMTAFANEETLIDFSTLTADASGQHPGTLIDFGSVAGASIDPQMRDLMKSSLAISNWAVDLNSSAQNAMSKTNTKVADAQVRQGAQYFGGQDVLGVRIQFPSEPYNAWALIRPPFEIPAYDPDGRFINNGVIENVGVIKQVGLWVYGLNYPHSISIILQDENNAQQEISLGYLDFDGWRQLIWSNPNYIDDVRDRELRSYPLYPNLSPIRKLIGFRVYRDGANQGGDFIVYLHDVKVVYDQALLDTTPDIDHDQIWGILAARNEDRRLAELKRLGNEQVLRFIEQELQATEDLTNDQQNP